MGGDLEQPTLEAPTGFLSPGQILGSRYRIRSELGRGGMGEVWRAFDLKLRVDVAVKSLRDELLSHERALETLRQEVRVAREVISPNVCRVFDLLEIEGRELVSMEYIDGTTLIEVLAERSPLELEETREIALQFLAGLEAIHRAGLVHRDIKPENVMITRSGRVVVMDFGIAKGLAAEGTGTVAGTPAYMAPEQERGEPVDARTDVFSAGVLLAEMMAPEGVRDREARQAVWRGVREDPLRLPESPWQSVLERAVARSPDERYASAAKLSRALEEVALRVEGAEDVTPYPGLAAFSEEDAGYFFGRELEVEGMWKKLRRPHLLALIGQSGAGKSSFLRAGLLASKPEGWGHVVLTPGSAPLASLRESLVAEMAGDTEAMLELVRGQDADTLVSAVSRWRQRHKKALVIIDQFEELFTLNPAGTQSEFAQILERLVLEADVHVLLSMRDDFLFHCSDQPALAPILTDLTLLRSPTGSALRRALVQPALKCGYRFEDEELVDEMVAEVSEERGALPLVAFAAAALWERREREAGLLTREAYEEIGGVAGALAQHAEATLERIGSERVPLVRELFRNLVTARGTRAARDRDELLSVFEEGEREAATEILASLVDARLLTSYELPAEEGEGAQSRHRIEIIHESLLSAWPRLVRWRTQDAGSVQLRDQLRQAARTWEERDRSDDLLWTGTAFREFELWRERYPGGLSETEERFEVAMTTLARRRQRRRRIASAAALSVLLGFAGVVSVLWRQAESARRASDAAQLLSLGRLEMEQNPSGAIAYALASLEIVDDPDARLFALETLWRGPTALRTTDSCYALGVKFSPDGRWLAVPCKRGIKLWSQNGGEARTLGGPGDEFGFSATAVFARGSSLLAAACLKHSSIHVWSIPDGEVVRSIEIDGARIIDLNTSTDGMEIVTVTESGGSVLVQSWPLPAGEPSVLGRTEKADYSHGSREWLVRHDGHSIYGRRLDALQAPERLLGWHDDGVTTVSFSADGRWVASGDQSGEVRVWSLAAQPESPLRTLASEDGSAIRALGFDSTGRRLAVAALGPTKIWDLQGPPGADPLVLTASGLQVNVVAFHPNNDWVVTAGTGLRIWPLARPYSHVLRGHRSQTMGVDFAADGSWMASSSSDGTIRQWPLTNVETVTDPVLYESPQGISVLGIAIDPGGRFVLAGLGGSFGTWVVPLNQGEPRLLAGFDQQAWHVAVSSDGRLAAAADGLFNGESAVIRVWDVETGGVRVLDPGKGERGNTQHLDFTPENRLVSGGRGSVRSWNIENGTFETLREGKGEWPYVDSVLSPNGRFLASFAHGDEHALVHDLESGDSWQLPSHREAHELAFDHEGELLVTAGAHLPALFTGEPESHLRAGPVTGGEAHVFPGHEGVVYGIAVSPDGRWIGSVGEDKTVRVWPRPHGAPFHTLPYEQLLDRLRALTNLRAVREDGARGGYRLEAGLFPGWETAPTW